MFSVGLWRVGVGLERWRGRAGKSSGDTDGTFGDRGEPASEPDVECERDGNVVSRKPPSLLRNDAPAGNHWLKVRLEGTKSNRSAIGSRVLVRYGGKVQAQCVTSQSSFLSSCDPRLHFGMGAATTADIEIHWPAGASETHTGVAVDHLVTIKEGSGIVKGRPFR
ncbi:MAG: ASPIC/UnbV domain-containing protein [Candidatus Sulfotelmatobacter sp.]